MSEAFVQIGERRCLLDAQQRLNVHATFGATVVLLRIDADAAPVIVPLDADGSTAIALNTNATYRLESVASVLQASGDLEARVARLEAMLAQSTEKSERQHNAAVADKLMDLERKRRESLMYDSAPLPALPDQPAPVSASPALSKPEPAPLKRAVHAEIKAVGDRRPHDLQKPVAPVRRPPATRPPPPGSASPSDAAPTAKPAESAEPAAPEATALSPVLSGRKLRATIDAARNAATRAGDSHPDSPASSSSPIVPERLSAAEAAPAPAAAAATATDAAAAEKTLSAEDAPADVAAEGDGDGSDSDPYADISDGDDDGAPAEPAPLLSALPMVNSTIDTTLHRSRPSLGHARRRPQRKAVARTAAEVPRFASPPTADAGTGRGGRGRALPAPRGRGAASGVGRGGGRGGAAVNASAPTAPAPVASPPPIAPEEATTTSAPATATLRNAAASPTPAAPTASSPPTTTEQSTTPPVLTSAAATAAAVAAISPRPVAPPRARAAVDTSAADASVAATSPPQLTRTLSPPPSGGVRPPQVARTLSPPPRANPVAADAAPVGPPPPLASRDSAHKPVVSAAAAAAPSASTSTPAGPPPPVASRAAPPPVNAPPTAPAAPNSIAAKQNNLAAIVARQAADQMAGRQGRPMTRPADTIAAPPMPGPPTTAPPPSAVAAAPPPVVPAEPPTPIAPSPVAPKGERLKSPGPSSRKERDADKSPSSRHKSPSRAKSPSAHRRSPSRAKSPSSGHRDRTHRRKKDGDSPQGSAVQAAPAAPAGDSFLVLFDYVPPADGDGELKLRVGDIIAKLSEDSGWWEGTNTTTGETGWFSPDFVKPYKRSN